MTKNGCKVTYGNYSNGGTLIMVSDYKKYAKLFCGVKETDVRAFQNRGVGRG